MSAEHSLAEQYATRIEAQVDELVRIIDAAGDDHWNRTPGPSEWNAAEICGHVIEMMPFWAEQAQQLAAHPGISFGREEHDERRLGGVATGARLSRHDAIMQLRAAAERACRIIRSLPDDAWHAEGVNVSRGTMTGEAIIGRLLAGHLESHVEQVRETLGHLEH